MRRCVTVLVAVLATGSCFAADDASRIAHTQRFDLHSDPWINLHHFLYQWARADEGIGAGRQMVEVPERASIGELSAADHAAWNEALDFYRQSVARLDHFDQSMLEPGAAT